MNRPFIISIFLPHHGCPHRCIFCNQRVITGRKGHLLSPETLGSKIKEFLNYKGKPRHPVQIAFYGGNFLGLEPDHIKSLLEKATGFVVAGKVDSIRFSTRPDTIDSQRLDILKPFPVTTIEIGAQSMDDQVLAAANRGHTTRDTEKAVALLKAYNYEVGVQMMVGLPGDDETKSMAAGHRIAELGPDFVRIYPTVVVAGSPLATLYQQGDYAPWPLDRCVTLVKKLYLLFKASNIAVVRMGLQPSEDLNKDTAVLAGPYHPAFGHLVHSAIFLDKAAAAIAAAKDNHAEITLKVHPRSISKMKGLNNNNVAILKRKFQIQSLHIVPDSTVSENNLAVI